MVHKTKAKKALLIACLTVEIILLFCCILFSCFSKKHPEVLAVSIQSPEIDEDGISLIWQVRNDGPEVIEFATGSIAQITINLTKYNPTYDAIVLQPGENYRLEIHIPNTYLRDTQTNSIKITAETTEGTRATFRQSFHYSK